MHTTHLEARDLQPGCEAWMIHNGDLSGDIEFHWEVLGPGGSKERKSAVLPDGMLQSAISRAVFKILSPALESGLDQILSDFWAKDLVSRPPATPRP